MTRFVSFHWWLLLLSEMSNWKNRPEAFRCFYMHLCLMFTRGREFQQNDCQVRKAHTRTHFCWILFISSYHFFCMCVSLKMNYVCSHLSSYLLIHPEGVRFYTRNRKWVCLHAHNYLITIENRILEIILYKYISNLIIRITYTSFLAIKFLIFLFFLQGSLFGFEYVFGVYMVLLHNFVSISWLK